MQLTITAMPRRPRGFSLIELMIAVVIFAFLVLLAGPMFSDFIGNSRIRNAAEALLNGVRLTQAEAVRRNTVAWFVFDPTTGYKVYALDPTDGTADDGRNASHPWAVSPWVFTEQGASRATATTAGNLTSVTFDGLGRILSNASQQPPDGTATLARINITNPDVSNPHNLSVVINTGGNGIKLCDPALPSTDVAGCP